LVGWSSGLECIFNMKQSALPCTTDAKLNLEGKLPSDYADARLQIISQGFFALKLTFLYGN
jgi:hypothetical protein